MRTRSSVVVLVVCSWLVADHGWRIETPVEEAGVYRMGMLCRTQVER